MNIHYFLPVKTSKISFKSIFFPEKHSSYLKVLYGTRLIFFSLRQVIYFLIKIVILRYNVKISISLNDILAFNCMQPVTNEPGK